MSTKIVSATSIKEGSFILLDGIACKVMSAEISKSGKHGHAKVRIVAIGLLDGKKREAVMPGHDNVEVPIIDKKTAQVLSVSGGKANVMDSESYETFDMAIPPELRESVVEGCQVLYWVVLGEKVMKQVKSAGDKGGSE
jgi:translation initiation factor 5A